MKKVINYLPLIIVIISGCGASGSYEYSQYEELDRAYRVFKGLEKRKWTRTSISNQGSRANKYMEEYLQSFSETPLSTPILETQRDSLFEDWGIYEKNFDNSEDTLFYVHLVPKISRIGKESDEIWVVESVSCKWWKSWRIRGFDLRPFVNLRYINANFESGSEDERINSDFKLNILLDQSTSGYIKLSWLFGGGIMDSKSRNWLENGFSPNLDGKSDSLLHIIDEEAKDLTQLIHEDWEIRSRGNVFQGLNR